VRPFVLDIAAPTNRAERYGVPGLYRMCVRTISCAGIGGWSDELFQMFDDGIRRRHLRRQRRRNAKAAATRVCGSLPVKR
jgi:hypothetical protein